MQALLRDVRQLVGQGALHVRLVHRPEVGGQHDLVTAAGKGGRRRVARFTSRIVVTTDDDIADVDSVRRLDVVAHILRHDVFRKLRHRRAETEAT